MRSCCSTGFINPIDVVRMKISNDLELSRSNEMRLPLQAIQNLAAMNVLCTDKTRTLTQDRVILESHLDIRGEDCEQVLEFAYLNSH